MPVVPKSAARGADHVVKSEYEAEQNRKDVTEEELKMEEVMQEDLNMKSMSKHMQRLIKDKEKKQKKKRKKKKKQVVKRRELMLFFDPKALTRSDSFNECRLCLDPGVLRTCCGNFY